MNFNGTAADAEAVKLDLEGFMGKFVKEAGSDAPVWNSANANEFIQCHVMADEQIREPSLLLHISEQI